jgi:hypothetical protein
VRCAHVRTAHPTNQWIAEPGQPSPRGPAHRDRRGRGRDLTGPPVRLAPARQDRSATPYLIIQRNASRPRSGSSAWPPLNSRNCTS